jgi:hypothetical protein
MRIFNPALLESALASYGLSIKFLMNEEAIAFFPVSQQHSDIKVGGLSYEDDYIGNALAGLIVSGKAEIRFHKAFSDEKVRSLWRKLQSLPEFSSLSLEFLSYQGRDLLAPCDH